MKLFVNYGVRIGVRDGMVSIRSKDGEKLISAGNLEQIVVLSGGVSISSAFLKFAAENSIDVLILNSNGSLAGIFRSAYKKANVGIRKEQYKAQNDERGISLAKCFVKGKIMNQYYLLKSLAKNRKWRIEECCEIRRRVVDIEKCENRQELIQLEAKVADIYWKGISNFFDFDRRRKKYDDPDAINMALNYGYAILASQVTLAIDSTNLDPFVGFLHADNPKRAALVYDLIEEFRQPVVDRAVLKLNPEEKNGFLTKKSRKEIVAEINKRLKTKVTFDNRKLPIEYHIYLQAKRIERFLVGKGKYKPFILR